MKAFLSKRFMLPRRSFRSGKLIVFIIDRDVKTQSINSYFCIGYSKDFLVNGNEIIKTLNSLLCKITVETRVMKYLDLRYYSNY